MPLKHRVMEPIKFVAPFDTALDGDGNYDEYRKAWDYSKLRLKPGEQPTVYVLNQLTDIQRDGVYRIAEDRLVDRCNMALRYGLTDAQNHIISVDGQPDQIIEPPRRVQGEYGSIVSQEWMDKARFTAAEKIMLGGVVLGITEARPPL